MKVFITGGAGFIGSHLCDALLKRGDEVVIADNLSTGTLDNVADALKRGARMEEFDVTKDAIRLEKLVREADVIIHLAAAVGVELVVNDPVRTITTNIEGSARLIALAAQHHKRIIIASTSEVYGKSAKEDFDESDDLLIGSPEHSRWSYACSKLLDEFYLMSYHRQFGLPGTVVRFFNTVGPRQTGRYGMVIPRFVRQALNHQPLQVYGDGGQSRCFCHVLDVVRALLLLLETPESIGQIYNIGSRRLITIEELAKLVIARSGSPSKIEIIPYEQAYASGFEDMRRRRPSTEKLHVLTGWEPQFSLEKILDDVIAEYRAK